MFKQCQMGCVAAVIAYVMLVIIHIKPPTVSPMLESRQGEIGIHLFGLHNLAKIILHCYLYVMQVVCDCRLRFFKRITNASRVTICFCHANKIFLLIRNFAIL